MTDLNLLEDLRDTISFNLFVRNDDGQVAWTVTPVVIDDLYSDRLSGSLPH
jgi:hypothetical protein